MIIKQTVSELWSKLLVLDDRSLTVLGRVMGTEFDDHNVSLGKMRHSKQMFVVRARNAKKINQINHTKIININNKLGKIHHPLDRELVSTSALSLVQVKLLNLELEHAPRVVAVLQNPEAFCVSFDSTTENFGVSRLKSN